MGLLDVKIDNLHKQFMKTIDKPFMDNVYFRLHQQFTASPTELKNK